MPAEWDLEDIKALNEPELANATSFLERLLDFGATSADQLIEAASFLESTKAPTVLSFGQLPFDLGLGHATFQVPGDRKDFYFALTVAPLRLHVDAIGKVRRLQNEEAPVVGRVVRATQLRGVIQLGEKRARVHPLYVSRLEHPRRLAEPLGRHKVENWMQVPEAKLAEPSRRAPPLTGFTFQRDVAMRAKQHLVFGTKSLLRSFGVSSLIDLRESSWVYGCHTMIAPGRMAMAGTFWSVLSGLVREQCVGPPIPAPPQNTRDFLADSLRSDDPFVQRLQALNALLAAGEPELAIVGCVTALEWFVNERFPQLIRVTKDGERRTAQLVVILKSEVAKLLDARTRQQLMQLSDRRNIFAHGPPPTGKEHSKESAPYAWDVLQLALRTYRAINIATS